MTPPSRSRRAASRAALRATVLGAALALGACAGTPLADLQPVAAASVAGAAAVPIHVATTRAATPGQPGLLFTGERGAGLTFARLDVSVPPSHQPGAIEWPRSSPPDPRVAFAVTRAEGLERPGFLRSVREAAAGRGSRDVLVFVHGYNTRFDEAAFRFAQIVHDTGFSGAAVLFTWPSRGQLLQYQYDRESATFSRDALEDTLRALGSEPGIGRIHVLAHSMGNLVTLEALRQHSIRTGGRAPAKVSDVMLAAPDVDADVFRTQIAAIGRNRPAFALFLSRDDRALAVSRRIAGDRPRLGALDDPASVAALEAERIAVYDLSAIRAADGARHARFATAPEVVSLIGRRLAAGQEINDKTPGLADRLTEVATGAASTVTGAAGLVLSAPVGVVEGVGSALSGASRR